MGRNVRNRAADLLTSGSVFLAATFLDCHTPGEIQQRPENNFWFFHAVGVFVTQRYR